MKTAKQMISEGSEKFKSRIDAVLEGYAFRVTELEDENSDLRAVVSLLLADPTSHGFQKTARKVLKGAGLKASAPWLRG